MMLRSIYRLLLRLRPREWRDEMLEVFDQARQDARARGWIAYTAFGAREIKGLLSLERGGIWRWALGGALAGLLAGWVFTLTAPEMYTSKALVRILPSSVPERYVPTAIALTFDSLSGAVLQDVYSRRALVNTIDSRGLYFSERKLMPMEDVVELMRKRIEIKPTNPQTIQITFSDSDPVKAQRVTRDILTHLIDGTIRERSALSMMTVTFLAGQADRAAAEWENLTAKVRSGPQTDRLMLDRQLASRRYETLRQQVSEAEMIAGLEEHKQGPTLELLDLPSLPERPSVSHATILMSTGLGGLLLGTLAGWLRRLSRANASSPAMIGA